MRLLMRTSLVGMMVLAGCADGDTDTDTTTDEDVPPVFEDFINITDVSGIGVATCWSPGDEWLEETPDPAKQIMAPAIIEVLDFESDERAPDLTLDVFNHDDVTGTVDSSHVTDENGEAVVTLPLCTPLGYRTSDPAGEAKDTYESHQFVPNPGEGVEVREEFNSVSRVTYLIIPSLLGIPPDPEKAIIAGTAYDCNDEPIQGLQVIAKDQDGNIPNDLVMKYFVDDFPNRTQPHTSPDGLWIAINVPPGTVTMEMYGVLTEGAAPELLGSTTLTTFADSINIANIPFGHTSGIKYPDVCLASE